MATFLTTNPPIDGLLDLKVLLNGQPANLDHGYILGVLQPGDKIVIEIEVDHTVDHMAFTLNSRLEPVYKTKNAESVLGIDTYQKKLTVTENREGTSTHVAGYPNNILGLQISGETYYIGVFGRNGKYFFTIFGDYAPIVPDNLTAVGTVLYFNPLRGIARVFLGGFEDARLHWSHMPFRKNLGFRAVVAGEVLDFTDEDLERTGLANTHYSYELKSCTLA